MKEQRIVEDSSLYNVMIKNQYMKHEKKLEEECPFIVDNKSKREKEVVMIVATWSSAMGTNDQLVFCNVSLQKYFCTSRY